MNAWLLSFALTTIMPKTKKTATEINLSDPQLLQPGVELVEFNNRVCMKLRSVHLLERLKLFGDF